MLRNKKGVMDPITTVIVGSIVMGAIGFSLGTALTYASAGKDQVKKNNASIWAHMQGKCTGATPDARCIY
jgi:hypothetical protein